MKKIAFIFITLFSLASMGQTKVEKYIPGNDLGTATYYLPKTAINITVTAIQTTFTPGELSKYARHYLRLEEVGMKAQTNWKIKSIQLSTEGIPNPEQTYTIRVKDKSIAPLLQLNRKGIIESINKDVIAQPSKKNITVKKQKEEKPLRPSDFLTEEILTTSSSAKMAEMIAQEIYAIREMRNNILRGQADNIPQDGAALKLILNNLNRQEEALKQFFVGKTTTSEKTFHYSLLPTKSISQEVLFRFSPYYGIVEADDLSGAPCYIALTDLKTVPPLSEEALEDRAKGKIRGVVYNVPGMAKVRLYTDKQDWITRNLALAQFGNQETLGEKLFNKKATTKVLFDPTTGALLKIERE